MARRLTGPAHLKARLLPLLRSSVGCAADCILGSSCEAERSPEVGRYRDTKR